MNIESAVLSGREILEKAGIEEALLDTRLLLCHILGVSRGYLYSHPEHELSREEDQVFTEIINKRAERIPLQHLTGEQDFMGLTFEVDKNVLIPRQDTETLVEEALKELHDGMRILDICTGSGCIILSLLKYSNDCSGVGIDISEDALNIAGRNMESLGIKGCDFLKLDILKDADSYINKERASFDIICSNPPYIPTKDIKALMPEVRDHDPHIALDGGSDGLLFYNSIAPVAKELLLPGGCLLFEIGFDQGDDVSNILLKEDFSHIEVIKDLAGNPRVVKAYK